MRKGALKNPLWTFPLAQIVSNGFTNFQNGNTDPINGDTKKVHFTRGTGQWGNSSWRQEASVVGSLLLPEASAWWKRGLHRAGGKSTCLDVWPVRYSCNWLGCNVGENSPQPSHPFIDLFISSYFSMVSELLEVWHSILLKSIPMPIQGQA